MADRFYGYQYDTNPRKINSQYTPYQNRYSRNEEPVETTNYYRRNNQSARRTNERYNRGITSKTKNRSLYETQEKTIPEYGKKQVVNNKKINKGVHKNSKNVRSDDVVPDGVNNGNVSKTNVKARLKIVLFLVAGFSVLFAISYQNSLISESFNKKEQYKKEMEALSKTNQQIEVSIENNLNLNTIEQSAKERIGMQKLSNSQKIYVSLPKQDYVAPASEQIVMEEETNFFQKLLSIFK